MMVFAREGGFQLFTKIIFYGGVGHKIPNCESTPKKDNFNQNRRGGNF
jgi:hypothetical protein